MSDEPRPESVPATGARSHRFRFGPFELDATLGELRRAGQTVPLRGQPVQILEILIRSPGELVTREALQHALWSDGTIVEFDDSLNNCVRRLRQALGDLASKPTYIETIPRRGYRFVGEVTPIPNPGVVETSQPAPAMPLRSPSPRVSTPAEDLEGPTSPVEQWRPSHAARLFTAVVLVSVFLAPDRSTSPGVGALSVSPDRAPARSLPGVRRIERRPTAVLTLFNHTPDPGLDWVGSALPELLTSRLAELPALRVFPRQTVGPAEFSLGIPNTFALDETLVDRLLTGLGSELTVAGRYDREGTAPREKLRIVLQLYDVRWKSAVATVSEVGDVDGLRDLAQRLAEDLRLEMGWALAPRGERDLLRSPIAADPLPTDLEASRLYSEALSHLSHSDGHSALQLLQAARSREPSFPYVYWAQTLTLADVGFASERLAARHLPQVISGLPAEERDFLQVLSACFDGWDTVQECQAADPILRRLWKQHHGDVEFGLRLAEQAPPGFVQTVVADIRTQGAPAWAEVRLDLLESGSTGVNVGGTGPVDCQRQLRVASHGVAAAREKQDRINLSKLLFWKGDALHCLGRDDDAVTAYQEANRVMLETGAMAAAVRQMRWFADRLNDMDRPSASRTVIAQALGIARGLGPPGRIWVNSLLDLLGSIEFASGHFDAVERVITEQTSLDSGGGSRLQSWLAIFLREAQGRLREAEHLAQVELDACREEPMCQLNSRKELSRILDLEDRADEAAEELQRLVPGPSDDVREFDTALHLVEIGDSERARQRIASWERSNPGIFGWEEARMLRVRNLLDLMEFSEAENYLSKGDPDAGRVDGRDFDNARQNVLLARIDIGLGRTTKGLARLRDVIAKASRGGWKAVELDARLEYGKAQRTAGNGAAALRTLASLDGEATSLGMLLLARHAREARQGH